MTLIGVAESAAKLYMSSRISGGRSRKLIDCCFRWPRDSIPLGRDRPRDVQWVFEIVDEAMFWSYLAMSKASLALSHRECTRLSTFLFKNSQVTVACEKKEDMMWVSAR